MVNFLLSFVILFASTNSNIDGFEGKIELVQESCYETSYFTYFVKKEKVRIDKFDSNHNLNQSMLINLESKQVVVLSPSKKLYTKLSVNEDHRTSPENFTILKTENSRMVGEYKCYQWRVKNIDRNTEVAYWVSQNNYYFFEQMVKLLNSTDRTYEFFEKIPETQGFFPMLSIERTLLRKEKSRLSVVNVSDKKMGDNLFTIPKDYELVIR
ncbi:MAG: hypothetical protein C0597_01425 [Marinilabiliales bacterium]|nr:MAG: hypothetical protein C0597_01425 [Marinilabiliales bacterium]